MLRDALSLTGEHAAPVRIGITAGEDHFVIMTEVTPAANVGALTGAVELSSLRDSARRAGIRTASRRNLAACGSPGRCRWTGQHGHPPFR